MRFISSHLLQLFFGFIISCRVQCEQRARHVTVIMFVNESLHQELWTMPSPCFLSALILASLSSFNSSSLPFLLLCLGFGEVLVLVLLLLAFFSLLGDRPLNQSIVLDCVDPAPGFSYASLMDCSYINCIGLHQSPGPGTGRPPATPSHAYSLNLVTDQ